MDILSRERVNRRVEGGGMKEWRLILTVGLPRSGKTTWARQQDYPIVNPDSIRLALHGKPFIPEAEGFVWVISYLMVRALFLAGHDVVIVDATNATSKRREEWYKRFSDCKIEEKIFDTSKEICIERAKKGNREDLIPVIERMAEGEEPNEVKP